MGKTSQKIANRVMEPINPALIVILGVYTTVWGAWVGNPFWEVFTRAPLYSQMAHFPEWAWGLFAFISGIGILLGVKDGTNKSLKYGAAVGYFHWLVVSGMYFLGDWQNTGGITSLAFCIYSLVVLLNLHKNPHINTHKSA
jgi:hypothetical protein